MTIIIILLLLFVNSLGLEIRECNRPLGLESGRVHNSQITASSSFDAQSTGPQHARIRTESGSGAWCPLVQINATSHEWIQVEFQSDVVISAIETQGRYDKGRGLEYPTGYMIEYWRSSLGRWARYKDKNGNEIIEGNTNTKSTVLRVLDGTIIGKFIRLIPVSEVTRTICMRFELYGCTYKDALLSYSMPDGSLADGLDLRDTSYDGLQEPNGHWSKGLGKLYDGILGKDNFEKHPQQWVGWRKDVHGPKLIINFKFSSRQNISAISFHTSNFLKLGAQVFGQARLFFSSNDDNLYSPRIVRFEYEPDKNFETARWVRIPIPNRLAKRLKIELTFASEADWLLLSEVKFESGNIPFQLNEDDQDGNELEIDPSLAGNSLTYFAVDDMNDEISKWVAIGILAVFFFGMSSLAILLYLLCCCKKSPPVKTAPTMYEKPEVQMMMLPQNSVKRISMNTYRTTLDHHFDHSLIEKASLRAASEASSEYADPDFDNLAEPLLKKTWYNFQHSMHYASSDILTNQNTPGSSNISPTTTLCSPLSSNSRYEDFQGDPINDSNPIEIERTSLHFIERLGVGEFGEVHLCRLDDRLVAIKYLREGADSRAESEFRREMRVMNQLRHQNVLRVIGMCTGEKPIGCMVEFMPHGDLKQYLQKQTNISAEFLFSIATQVAAGMSYLESKNFIHRDLAARNCLVDSDGTIKISDFGMARSLYSSEYYKVEGQFALPIRWLAWECLLLGRFTSKSDVWAFGVTMWEILNLCREKPYNHLMDNEIIENIQHLYNTGSLKVYLPKPHYCIAGVYSELMLATWRKDESSRPSFSDIHRQLQNLLRTHFSNVDSQNHLWTSNINI